MLQNQIQNKMTDQKKKVVNMSLEQKQLVKKGILKVHSSLGFLQDPEAKQNRRDRLKRSKEASK